jgi:type IV fimbrial biogenesis protein FimT
VGIAVKIYRGFTFIELLITIALLAILLALAVPAYQTLAANARADTQIDQLVTAINFARSEAIRRRITVTLCASVDQHSCGKKWRDGWLVFTDKKASGQIEAGDAVLRVFSALANADRLEWTSSLNKSYLQMDPGGGTRGQSGTFTYYSARNNAVTRSVVVSQTGRVRIEK